MNAVVCGGSTENNKRGERVMYVQRIVTALARLRERNKAEKEGTRSKEGTRRMEQV